MHAASAEYIGYTDLSYSYTNETSHYDTVSKIKEPKHISASALLVAMNKQNNNE
jgi:hypothetical protein